MVFRILLGHKVAVYDAPFVFVVAVSYHLFFHLFFTWRAGRWAGGQVGGRAGGRAHPVVRGEAGTDTGRPILFPILLHH